MIASPEESPRKARTVWVIAGALLILIGFIGVGLAAAASIAVPGGAVRTSVLVVESDECPILVLEQPVVTVEISGYEWLQEVAALQPEVEISSAGSVFTTPTESLPELVLGVAHCRLTASDKWRVVTVPGANRGLDSSLLDTTTVKRSSENTAVLTPRELDFGSLIIEDPGEVRVQGVLTAPWSARDVQLLAVLGAVVVISGSLMVIRGSRTRSKGKHESRE